MEVIWLNNKNFKNIILHNYVIMILNDLSLKKKLRNT